MNVAKVIKALTKGKRTIPVLGMVRIYRFEGLVTIECTDLDVFMSYKIASKGDNFDVLVNGQTFASVFKKADNVIGELVGDLLNVNGMNLKVDKDSSVYPLFYKMYTVLANYTGLSAAVEPLLHSVSPDPTRYHLNGVYSDLDNIVSTDGHRITILNGAKLPIKAIIPTKAIQCAVNLDLDNVEIVSNGGAYQGFKTPDLILGFRAIEGTYPNYKQFVPLKYDKRASVNVKSVTEALKQIKPHIENKKSMQVKILIANDNFTVMSGVNAISTPMKTDEKPIEFSVNHKYLTDAVNLFKGLDAVNIGYNGATAPVRFSAGPIETVVMPMRA